jgi:fructose-bisphosphate aldolase class II
MLTTLNKVLRDADKGGYAVGAFNVNNLEILRAVIDSAVELRSPVIIQTSEGAIQYAGLAYLAAMIGTAAKAPVPVVMHVDHGKDLKIIKAAIDAGYSSVMYDGSALPYTENVRNTRQAVRWAAKRGVSVEAEIGAIKGIEDLVSVSEKEAFYTDPAEAKRFVDATGIDALAVSIGTAHGPNKSKTEPKLDIARLKAIKLLVKQPIVLHGASGINEDMVHLAQEHCDLIGDCERLSRAVGIPDAEIKKAIRAGVRKINIDSDLRIAFTAGLRQAVLEDHKSIDPRKLLAPSMRLMKEVVARKMVMFGSKAKA